MFGKLRLVIVGVLVSSLCGAILGAPAPAALAAAFGVCPTCQYHTIQDALAHANDGDVIKLAPGTYAGPLVILKSVRIIGAGPTNTIIKGGGNAPVVRIGVFLAPTEPSTVSISGVTITGGNNTSDTDPFQDSGGGIKVEGPADPTSGNLATVTISNSLITGNRVQSSGGGEPCGSDPTPTCSGADGGGIASFGNMTLINTTVSNNVADWQAGSAGTFNGASGGGIVSVFGLTLRNSTVTGNTVSFATADPTASFDGAAGGGIRAVGPVVLQNSTINGNTVRFEASAPVNMNTAGGGINEDNAPLTMDGSAVSNNQVITINTSTDPGSGLGGVGGGVHIGDGASGTIRGSQITGNRVTTTAYVGFDAANAGGIDDDGSLLLVGSSVSNNQVSTTITSSATTATAFSTGGGMEVDGTATIKGATLSGNSNAATTGGAMFSQGGGTFALGGALFVGGGDNANGPTVTMSDSVVTGNRATATSASGTATAPGGGIANAGTLTLRNTRVSDNVARADGGAPDSFTAGGGIWNDNPPGFPPRLTLIDSTITHNSLVGSSTAVLQGGGLFNGSSDGATVSATNSTVALNSPDNCYPAGVVAGCSN